MAASLLNISPDGLYCEAGGFHIDPWNPVARAIVTHSHSDHARRGSGTYFTVNDGVPILRARIGEDMRIESAPYGEARMLNGVAVSLHPAGHILGSAQVRVEYRGEVWVVSGDYKIAADRTCEAFEPVRCHTFITESTFGLPIYRWPSDDELFRQIHGWWIANQSEGKASVIFGYALGKAQRILSGLDPAIGPIFVHGAIRKLNDCYRASGIRLPVVENPMDASKDFDWSRALIIAPPSAAGTPWQQRFGPASTALASGWMRIRGTRRRGAFDRGIVLSDHADWPGLLSAIHDTEAENIWVTHGYRSALVRWLVEQGKNAQVVETRWEGEREEPEAATE